MLEIGEFGKLLPYGKIYHFGRTRLDPNKIRDAFNQAIASIPKEYLDDILIGFSEIFQYNSYLEDKVGLIDPLPSN